MVRPYDLVYRATLGTVQPLLVKPFSLLHWEISLSDTHTQKEWRGTGKLNASLVHHWFLGVYGCAWINATCIPRDPHRGSSGSSNSSFSSILGANKHDPLELDSSDCLGNSWSVKAFRSNPHAFRSCCRTHLLVWCVCKDNIHICRWYIHLAPRLVQTLAKEKWIGKINFLY